MAKLLKAKECSVVDVEPKNGTDFTYEELRRFVGGYIEIIPLNKKQIMVVNEEGKVCGLPYNLLATETLQLAFQPCNDFVVGDALICDTKQVK